MLLSICDMNSELWHFVVLEFLTIVALRKNNLENFARKHKGDIKKDPEFRRQLSRLTRRIFIEGPRMPSNDTVAREASTQKCFWKF